MYSPNKSPDVDLIISDVNVPDLVKLNEDLQIDWTVTNQGKEATTTDFWYDNVYLSSDKDVDCSDYTPG
jgi:hypothetical protein